MLCAGSLPVHRGVKVFCLVPIPWRYRQKALLSHIWNCAKAWGITDKDNPCRGIKGFPKKGRNTYIEDDLYQAVWQAADETLLDFAYLTRQGRSHPVLYCF